MTGESNRCPDPEVLAAFVAGNLSGMELEMMAEHLRTCEDCQTIVGDTAFVARQDDAVVSAARPSWSPWWLAAAAAALLGLFFLSYWYARVRRGDHDIHTLVAAAPRNGRYLEPRLSGGFPWAPLRPARRTAKEPLDAGQMKLVGAAGTVLERTAGDRSVAGQHAAALAHLVAGRPGEAAALLAPLAGQTSDARIWADLAAARFVAATQTNDSPQLAQALAAADAALRINPKLPEALFDRALILERLGLRQQAIAAWQQYLSVDSGSAWTEEVRQHLRALSTQSSFDRELRRDYVRLGVDQAAARALAARYPQEARVWGETEILARWAEAWQSHDRAADSHLSVARAFGDELAERSGDRMLQSTVAAIDAADDSRKRALAEAHIRFRTAQKTYRSGRPADAEPLFAEAAAQFEAGGSPLAPVARYFAANTAFDQGRINEAKSRLETLLAAAPPQLPAHRAQVEWELGLVNAGLGRWGEAMRLLRASIATFEGIGEIHNATAVREILAEVYDQIGEPTAAWHHRIIALRELGRTPSRRLRVAVESIATAAVRNRDWAVALSFLGVELEVIQKGDTMALIDTLLLRARVQQQLGRTREGARDLARATEAVSRLRDSGLHSHAEAECLAVEAYLAEPANAVALLSRAIEFHRKKGRRIFLPEMLLERGRAMEAVGNGAAAAADFDQAIAELEAQRTSIDPGDERWGVFTGAGDLFDNAIGLAVARGDTRGALAYSERSRANALLDRVSAELSPIPEISKDTVIVEYVALPAHLVIFVVEHGRRLRVVQQDVKRSTLAVWIEQLAESAAIDDRATFRRVAALLYARLVAPVADSVDVARLVVFVPDDMLSAIPFSALVDGRGRYLIERQAVVIAPSLAVYERLASRARQASPAPRALVIAGPSSRAGDLRDLSAATREAEAVASAYPNAVMMGPNDGGRRDALTTRTSGVNIIHFVGHAREPESNADAALVTSSADDDVLDVRSIASMRLSGVDVVVLAACSTARGHPGSRNISVAHAFVAAGVPSVVATLWPIADDPAAEFFPRLHRRLAERVPAAEALRSIQLEWIYQRNAPPVLWAAIETIGS
jgi:CHAT domain-containing protein/TolA-binding protein